MTSFISAETKDKFSRRYPASVNVPKGLLWRTAKVGGCNGKKQFFSEKFLQAVVEVADYQ